LSCLSVRRHAIGICCFQISSTLTTTTTEITTTTTTKKRKIEDIKFKTFFERKASLRDLHNAGIISDEIAEKLEMGVIQEQEV